ncbi:phospholipase D family protein [Pararoseomonas indoligenes]|uniref:Phospholipase D n=1 Tax=Roseomonas indoligenes TaxID=2820811 RepID=A0A940S891_9PROT|nr:phospholipase D family protein [Pararoseomonas indoligenes]MBP0493933.1 phospholipase D family protein [Pararoseomonas indoligenes]
MPDATGTEGATTAPATPWPAGGSGVAVAPDGLVAFAARCRAAREAQESLDLLYYIWRDDLTGRLLAREVLRAAGRGVRVRLLLDDMYALGRERVLSILDAHPHIEVRLFNPTRWRRFGQAGMVMEMLFGGRHLNRRMHNKAWIADGRVAVVGGRNVGDEYYDASGAFNFRDLDLVLAGQAVRDVQAVFERYWRHPLARTVRRASGLRPRPGRLAALTRRLDMTAAGERARPFLEGLKTDPGVAKVMEGGTDGLTPLPRDAIRVVADSPDKVLSQAPMKECLAPAILEALQEARQEALLISPYFVPGEDGMAVLEGLARKGVRVAVVTNSLAATDVVAVHGGYARHRGQLLDAGIELYELKRSGKESAGVFGSRGASLHTKALVVDGGHAFVGSFNLDPRSATLNTEMGVFVRHAALSDAVQEEFARLSDPARSWQVMRGKDGGLCWNGPDGTVTAEPDASLRRRALAWLVRWLPIESQL